MPSSWQTPVLSRLALGRWHSTDQYRLAVGLREIACVQNIAQLPRSPLSLYGPGTYSPSRSKKVAALQNYLRLVKYLPTDPAITSAFLEVLPLFDHAQHFDKLDPTQQAKTQDLYIKMSLSAYYRRFAYTNNMTLFKAMEFRQTTSFDMLVLAQNLLVDGEALYQAHVRAASKPPFPLQFSEEEVVTTSEDVTGAIKGMQLMQGLKQSLDSKWPDKGVVRPEEYDEVKALLNQAKTELIERLAHSEEEKIAWEEAWPFDS
ncbi:hypothetical protein BDV06DRAFT_215601 [Aspergillus oleicola]